jgi:hypothetical protein
MDISKLVAELREERARLDEAINILVKLPQSGTPRRGRPPAWSRAAAVTPRSRNGQNGSLHVAASSLFKG